MPQLMGFVPQPILQRRRCVDTYAPREKELTAGSIEKQAHGRRGCLPSPSGRETEGEGAAGVKTDAWQKDLEQSQIENIYRNSADTVEYLKVQCDEARGILADLGLAK